MKACNCILSGTEACEKCSGSYTPSHLGDPIYTPVDMDKLAGDTDSLKNMAIAEKWYEDYVIDTDKINTLEDVIEFFKVMPITISIDTGDVSYKDTMKFLKVKR
jgi:hypothetical protein